MRYSAIGAFSGGRVQPTPSTPTISADGRTKNERYALSLIAIGLIGAPVAPRSRMQAPKNANS